jgi:DNA repair photolyase
VTLRPVSNPPNPWQSVHAEWIDAPPAADLEVFEERVKSILTENDSPDLPFRFSLNPYRGCFHACMYCYARVSHQYWGFGAGTDFERKIVVKIDAPEKLREAFLRPSWRGDTIAVSGNTDCYQPLEASYRLTRRCLEVCAGFANPVGIITKAALIRRDIDVLQDLSAKARLSVTISIPFADDSMARKVEPYAPSPTVRFAAMRALADAGIDVGVGVAPIIPGMNDSQVPQILQRAADAGARRAFRMLLRLPAEVRTVFLDRLAQEYPDRVRRVTGALSDMQEGRLYRSEFGARGRGTGPSWEAVDWLFRTTCRRLGLATTDGRVDPGPSPRTEMATTFRRPDEQATLFGGTIPARRRARRPRPAKVQATPGSDGTNA